MKVIHWILTKLLHGIANLPFRILYIISDIIFISIYYIIRYRRRIVRKNLTDSFPNKDLHEIKGIEKHFYKNFSDYIVETIKLMHITDDEMRKRMTFENYEVINTLLGSGISIACYFSHCFNWEWGTSILLWTSRGVNQDSVFCQVYRPLRDKWFDDMMLKVRSRFGSVSIPKKQTLRELLTYRKKGIPTITGFMSDQKPSHGDPTFVTMFLNHPTAFITGTETLARRMNMAAIYWDMIKIKRGYYKIKTYLLAQNVAATQEMATTAKYAEMLEATIERDPSIWLWTHNRWKKPVILK